MSCSSSLPLLPPLLVPPAQAATRASSAALVSRAAAMLAISSLSGGPWDATCDCRRAKMRRCTSPAGEKRARSKKSAVIRSSTACAVSTICCGSSLQAGQGQQLRIPQHGASTFVCGSTMHAALLPAQLRARPATARPLLPPETLQGQQTLVVQHRLEHLQHVDGARIVCRNPARLGQQPLQRRLCLHSRRRGAADTADMGWNAGTPRPQRTCATLSTARSTSTEASRLVRWRRRCTDASTAAPASCSRACTCGTSQRIARGA